MKWLLALSVLILFLAWWMYIYFTMRGPGDPNDPPRKFWHLFAALFFIRLGISRVIEGVATVFYFMGLGLHNLADWIL